MKILFASSDEGGCAYYRSYLPSKYLKPYYNTEFVSGFPVNSFGQPSKIVENSDVIILQRHNSDKFLDWIPKWRAEGKKVIYDIDDNFWCIPSWNPNRKYYTTKTKLTMEVIIRMCDAVITSTEPLTASLSRFNKNCFTAPNLIENFYPRSPSKNQQIRIGWGGSKTHQGDFESKLVHVLKHCQKKYDAKIIWLGYRMVEVVGDALIPPTTMSDYLDKLSRVNLDIALAPLSMNQFNTCKSNLKFLEYSSCQYPSILSEIAPYRDSVKHSETGYLVKKKEWDTYIEYLCENESERLRIGQAAYEYTKSNFSWQNNVAKHLEVYKAILGE